MQVLADRQPVAVDVQVRARPAATASAFGISRVSSGSTRPSTEPATLKVRSTTAPIAPVRAWNRTACSAASFEAPYGLAGAAGSLSGIGCRSGVPYTAAVEPSTTRSASTASSRFTVPWTLAVKYRRGASNDSRTRVSAARWQIPS